jgi:hypothetical protein
MIVPVPVPNVTLIVLVVLAPAHPVPDTDQMKEVALAELAL